MIRELLSLFFAETQAQIDDRALDELVDYLSIDPRDTIQWLQRKELAWADRVPIPSKEELNQSADYVVQRAVHKATLRGAIAGTAGIISILPEQIAHWAQMLRLIQRLAIIYGIELQSSIGQAYLIHAFAYMYEVPLPKQHAMKLKISEVVSSFQHNKPDPNAALQYLLKQIVRQTISRQGRKLIPGIGIFLGAYDAHKDMSKLAERGKQFFAKRHRTSHRKDDIEEAIEILKED